MALTKIYKNVSGAEDTIRGVVLANNGTYTIPEPEWNLWSIDDDIINGTTGKLFTSAGQIGDGSTYYSGSTAVTHLQKRVDSSSDLTYWWAATVFLGSISTTSTSYYVLCATSYGGTNNGCPTIKKVMVDVRYIGSGSMSFRLYNITNATTICSKLAFTTSSTWQITDLGTISDVPTSDATFQLEMLVVGSGTASIRGFTIR